MRRLPYLIAGAAWLVASLAGGVLLVRGATTSSRHAELLARAQHLAVLLGATAADRQSMQQELDAAARYDPEILYAMTWKPDGEVLAHTHREAVGQFLDASKWPALDAEQAFRVAKLEVQGWTKPDARSVLEFTAPVRDGDKAAALVSMAYQRDGWGDANYLIIAAAFSVMGSALIVAGGELARRRFERARQEIVQEARARTSLLTERGMLASVLAHEIRSPLTALRFNLHALRQLLALNVAEGEKQTELTDRCEREIRRLDNMLTDFLHHTQVIGGAAIEPTAINTVVHEAIEFLRPTLERAAVHVSLHLDPADPRVNVHPDELRQVILNLTANAQEAMQNQSPQKPRTLAISTIAAENAGTPTAMLLIRDSGPGISPKARERIFEPFFSTKPNGSGLGLTLVRRVISGAGGTVLYESSPEENTPGTTFRITLPRSTNGSA